jgi:hypothetical protein
LDDQQLHAESILAVHAEGGSTHIAELDKTGRAALRDRLYTPGELLRLNQIKPDPEFSPAKIGKQSKLFDEES